MGELRQCLQYAEYMRLIDWKVIESPQKLNIYVKKLPVLPVSVMKVQRVPWEKIDFNWLDGVVKSHNVMLHYIELTDPELSNQQIDFLIERGFTEVARGMLPTKTLRIATDLTESQFLDQLKSKTRYNLGLAKRNGLKISLLTGNELIDADLAMSQFVDLLGTNNKRLRMLGVNKKWMRAKLTAFGDMCFVVMIWDSKQTELLSANLFLTTKEAGYYEENGSSEKGRKLKAPTLGVFAGWEEIKRRKLEYLDFDGVYDDRYPIKRWQGFSTFKHSFGGEEICYPPAYKKWW